MDRTETLAIMSVLKAAYPSYYRDMKRADAESVVALWSEMFAGDDYAVVAAAVKGIGFACIVTVEIVNSQSWTIVERVAHALDTSNRCFSVLE